jgi:nitroreductase
MEREVKMELKEAVKTRRSIRAYKSNDISDDVLKEIFELVKMSPSWANTQCWEFVVVRDKDIKEQLVDTMPEKNPARRACLEAPVLIVALGKKGLSGFKQGQSMTNKGDNWYMFDVGIAMQTFSLVVHDMGLGSVILGLFDAEKAGKILNVQDGVEVVAMAPLGYPAKESKCPPRKDVNDFVFKDSYGKKLF